MLEVGLKDILPFLTSIIISTLDGGVLILYTDCTAFEGCHSREAEIQFH